MQSIFTKWALTIVSLFFALSISAQQEDPPETMIDNIRNGETVRRGYFDDSIAVYVGGTLMPDDVLWMVQPVKTTWNYMQETYGDFTDDGANQRIYVVAHSDETMRSATIATRWDASFGYNSTINLGGAWNWKDSTARVNYEVFIHELSHIVEGSNNYVKESPSYGTFWGDGPWPDIFIYDVYKNAFKDDELAQNWFNIQRTNTPGRTGTTERYPFFREFFYPIWEREESAAVFDRYFKLLSEHFRQQPITDPNVPDSIPTSAFRASQGEILYFFNAASGVDNQELYTNTFGWNEDREEELLNARYYYDLDEIGDTIDFPNYEDITSAPAGMGLTSNRPAAESPAAEQLANLTDGSYLTKWLTRNRSAEVQFEGAEEQVVTAYTITSANDAALRDPLNWTLEGSNDGTTWAALDSRSDEDFPVRFYQRLFTFDNDVAYKQHRLSFGEVEDATNLQVAEVELLSVKSSVSVWSAPDQPMLEFEIYPNPVDDRVFVVDGSDFDTDVVVRVLSTSGRLLSTQRGGIGAGIDVSTLPKGAYLIQVETDRLTGVRKFLKE